MQLKKDIARSIARDAALSVFIYALPVALMLFSFYWTGSRPWETHANAITRFHAPHFVEAIFKNLKTTELPALQR